MNTTNYKINPNTILELSSRTVGKIIKRAELSCSICNWNQAYGDIHHITEIENGGTNAMSNLIYVCPNCHRCIHQIGEKFKTKEELENLSLEKTFTNWLDFYNPQRNKTFISNSTRINTKTCLNINCNNTISIRNKNYCSSICASKQFHKVEWSEDLLLNTLKEFNCNLTKCGEKLKVSDNAFKKQCINFGINIKELKQNYKRVTAQTIKKI